MSTDDNFGAACLEIDGEGGRIRVCVDRHLREFARVEDATQIPEGIARIVRLFERPYGPVLLGAFLYVLVVAMVILSPTAPSHFIYTDF